MVQAGSSFHSHFYQFIAIYCVLWQYLAIFLNLVNSISKFHVEILQLSLLNYEIDYFQFLANLPYWRVKSGIRYHSGYLFFFARNFNMSWIVLNLELYLSRLNNRIKKLTTNKFGSQESGLNRLGISAPTTNKHAIEGSNPIFNVNSDDVKRDLSKFDDFDNHRLE